MDLKIQHKLISFEGTYSSNQVMLNASFGGIIKSKTHAKAKVLIKNIASNDYEVQNERT